MLRKTGCQLPSDKLCMEGLCQSLKTPCKKENMVSTAIKCERYLDLDEKISKSAVTEDKAADGRKILTSAQVGERNLVYIAGIPAVLADEEILRRKEYFGQYGRISKVLVVKIRSHRSQISSAESTLSVYVTFFKADDAMRCIQSMNGYILNGKMLKASFGKKESYHTYFKEMHSNHPDCVRPPEESTWEDNYTEEEGTWQDNCDDEQLHTQAGRKRGGETDWDKKRAEGGENNGDNFSYTKNDSKPGQSWAETVRPPWDSCKRQKFDARKVKDEVCSFPETETSSIESANTLTDGKGAISVASSANPVAHEFVSLADRIIKLDASNCEHVMVQRKFYMGLGLLASFASIKCIHKHCHRTPSGRARLQAFQRQEETTKIFRGASNVRYAWLGTSKAGVSVIILHGFGQPLIPRNGAIYGIGVYLAPEDYSHVGAVYSDVDENGEQHMVLCRVIMGNMEQIEQGSEQFHPTNEDYDTGVDDLYNPRWYIVWSTHMNMHILPEYIVSFKLSSPWNDMTSTLRGKHEIANPIFPGKGVRYDGQMAECRTSPNITSCTSCIGVSESVKKHGAGSRNSLMAPRSPWMSFPMLFLVLKAEVSEAQMNELQQHYVQFKVGKLPRDQLIRAVRSIAGDRVLSDSIRNMQAQHASLLGMAFGDQGFQRFRNSDS